LKTVDLICSDPTGTDVFTVSPSTGKKDDKLTITGYNLVASEAITVRFGGSILVSLVADANGAFRTTYTIPAMAGGDYYLNALRANGDVSPISKITVTPALSISASSGASGSTFTITGYGLAPSTSYYAAWQVKIGGTWYDYYGDISVYATSNDIGTLTLTATVPIAPATSTAFSYQVGLKAVPTDVAIAVWKSFEIKGTPTTGAPIPSYELTVAGSTYFYIPLSKVELTLAEVGSLVEPVYVTIYLDGKAIDTVTAKYDSSGTGTLYAAFRMPNGDEGPVKLQVAYRDSRVQYLYSDGSDWYATYDLTDIPANAMLVTAVSAPNAGIRPIISNQAFETVITRISGSGALLIGADLASDIAYIKTKVNTIAVSLSDLDAKIVALNETVAIIDTNIGLMYAKLDDINATVVSIEGDMVLVQTSLGDLEVKLDDIDAKIVSLAGDVATINTAVGELEVKLDDIGLKVTSINGSIVTIETDLGTIEGYVKDVDNGGLATISTALGTVQTNVSTIKGYFPITVAVDMTPVWIALALSLIAALSASYAAIMISRKIAG
jgi:outer membrane murein-binding lipoprotein Lpp